MKGGEVVSESLVIVGLHLGGKHLWPATLLFSLVFEWWYMSVDQVACVAPQYFLTCWLTHQTAALTAEFGFSFANSSLKCMIYICFSLRCMKILIIISPSLKPLHAIWNYVVRLVWVPSLKLSLWPQGKLPKGMWSCTTHYCDWTGSAARFTPGFGGISHSNLIKIIALDHN